MRRFYLFTTHASQTWSSSFTGMFWCVLAVISCVASGRPVLANLHPVAMVIAHHGARARARPRHTDQRWFEEQEDSLMADYVTRGDASVILNVFFVRRHTVKYWEFAEMQSCVRPLMCWRNVHTGAKSCLTMIVSKPTRWVLRVGGSYNNWIVKWSKVAISATFDQESTKGSRRRMWLSFWSSETVCVLDVVQARP